MNHKKSKKNLEYIQRLTLMDDVFMTKCFQDSPESIEFILRIILDKYDMKVIESNTQEFIENLPNRSVCFDVLAIDSENKMYDIEIQRNDNGANARRARLHSSLLDTKSLEKGKDYRDLKDNYVIFITENDVLGNGMPITQFDRHDNNTGKPFGDGSHIIYVNGAYQNSESPIGKLIHDFKCAEPDKMYYDELASRTRHFKEQEGGNTNMSSVVDEIKKDVATDIMTAIDMISSKKYSLSEVADETGVPLETVQKLEGKLNLK